MIVIKVVHELSCRSKRNSFLRNTGLKPNSFQIKSIEWVIQQITKLQQY